MICLYCRLNEAHGASVLCLVCQLVEQMWKKAKDEQADYEYLFQERLRRHG